MTDIFCAGREYRVAAILEDLNVIDPAAEAGSGANRPNLTLGQFTYLDCSKPLKDGVPLPPTRTTLAT